MTQSVSLLNILAGTRGIGTVAPVRTLPPEGANGSSTVTGFSLESNHGIANQSVQLDKDRYTTVATKLDCLG